MSDRKLFFNRLHTFFLSPGDLILGGDFNCIDSELDRLHIKSDFGADKRCLSALKSDFCLVDVFRKQNPKAISFTWSNKDFSQASRLPIAPIFPPLFCSHFAEISVFLVLFLITILSTYLFLRLMFLCTEAFGNLIALFSPIPILLTL